MPYKYRPTIRQRTAYSKSDGSGTPLAKVPERIVFYGLLMVIFLSGIPYGTADPFFRSLTVISVCSLGAVRIVQGVLGKRPSWSEPALFLPLACVLLIAVLQTLPFSPLGAGTISLDPYETKLFVVFFAAILIAFEMLYFYTRSSQELKALVGLVLVTGAASAVFGIVRELLPNDPEGFVATYFAGDSQGYAQFINRNHFGVLMEMTLGLSFGLMLKGDLSERLKFLGWVLAALLIYTTIAANSRGGIFSVAAMSLFAVFVHVLTRRTPNEEGQFREGTVWRKVLIATALSCLVFGGVVFTISFVGGDAVATRFEKLETEVRFADEGKLNRLSIWRATGQMIRERPLLGAGFGAFASAFPAFDESAGESSVQQAHNDYLEILASGGVVAFLLFAVFAVMVVRRAWVNFNSDDSLVRSSCFGALIGMFGVLVHSFVDFGLHLFINALIFAVLVVIATVRFQRVRLLKVN